MKGITRDCVREMIDRKALWIYGVITALALLIVVGMRSMRVEQFGPGGQGSVTALSDIGAKVTLGGIETLLSLLVFITIFVTAGLIPSMLVRGRAEFYLSKPLSRTSLLLNKLLSVWAVYGAVIVVAGLITWGMFYASFGAAAPQALWLFVFNLLALFLWLSVIIFAGIFSGSTAMAIVTAFLLWIVQELLTKRAVLDALLKSKFILRLVDALYYVLPKTSEMAGIGNNLAGGEPVKSWMPLWSTMLFALVMVVAAIYIFKSRDY